MPRPAIAIDVDEVLLQWLDCFCSWLIKQGYKNTMPIEEVINHNISASFVGMNPDIVFEQINKFHVSEDYGKITRVPGASAGMAALRGAFAGSHRIIAVTLTGEDTETIRMRRRNIEPFGFDEIFTLPLRVSKREILLRENVRLLVDDTPRNICEAREADIPAILFDPKNRHIEDPCRAERWQEVVEMAPTILARAAAA